jgi:hypothetical protein
MTLENGLAQENFGLVAFRHRGEKRKFFFRVGLINEQDPGILHGFSFSGTHEISKHGGRRLESASKLVRVSQVSIQNRVDRRAEGLGLSEVGARAHLATQVQDFEQGKQSEQQSGCGENVTHNVARAGRHVSLLLVDALHRLVFLKQQK